MRNEKSVLKRYVIMTATLVALLLVVLVLRPKPDGVDILISLKETNQQIAPAALSCPEWSYPEGSTQVCQVEGPGGRAEVEVAIIETGVSFADPSQAAQVLAEVSAEE